MSIEKGDPIPEAKLFELDEQGTPHAVSAAARFAGKRVVLFAVPGAYTRTCSEKHLPSFVQHAEAIKARGIDEIVCGRQRYDGVGGLGPRPYSPRNITCLSPYSPTLTKQWPSPMAPGAKNCCAGARSSA
jgi:Redoxin